MKKIITLVIFLFAVSLSAQDTMEFFYILGKVGTRNSAAYVASKLAPSKVTVYKKRVFSARIG